MGKLPQNKRKRYDFFFLKDYLAKELIGNMAISAPITPLVKHLKCIFLFVCFTFKPMFFRGKKALRKSTLSVRFKTNCF